MQIHGHNKIYLSRSQTRSMSAYEPIGDAYGGAAYGERNDPVTAAVVVGGSLYAGNQQANAAEHAADMQRAAASQATDLQRSTFNTQNAQQAAYRSAGYNALNKINSMMGQSYVKYDSNGNPIGTVVPAEKYEYKSSGNGINDLIAGLATSVLNQQPDTINPTPQDATSDYLTHRFNAQDFAQGIDPGYAWRLQQGQMANQRAANIGGGALSGNTLAGLQAYTQGQASQEYGNAFNRYQTERGNIYNTLASIAGLGQTAQGQTNQLASNYANNVSNLMTGSAAAQAAGTVGAANAQAGAIQNATNTYALSNMLNRGNQGVNAFSSTPSGYGTVVPTSGIENLA